MDAFSPGRARPIGSPYEGSRTHGQNAYGAKFSQGQYRQPQAYSSWQQPSAAQSWFRSQLSPSQNQRNAGLPGWAQPYAILAGVQMPAERERQRVLAYQAMQSRSPGHMSASKKNAWAQQMDYNRQRDSARTVARALQTRGSF